jgi:hypothetical protein
MCGDMYQCSEPVDRSHTSEYRNVIPVVYIPSPVSKYRRYTAATQTFVTAISIRLNQHIYRVG